MPSNCKIISLCQQKREQRITRTAITETEEMSTDACFLLLSPHAVVSNKQNFMIWSLSKICALNITDSLTNVCKVVCCVANMLQYRQLFNVFEYTVGCGPVWFII